MSESHAVAPKKFERWNRTSRTSGPAWVADSRRVLLIEDDPGIRKALGDMLADLDYAVLRCENGQEALEILARAEPAPEIIILDLMLPVMDGWEFRLRQRADSRLGGIPVLVISADGSPKAAAIDADGFLPKPFRSADLLQALERIARRQERVEHSQALMAMGTVVASVAHEIKNPLTYVLGNMELARRTALEMAGQFARLRQSSLPLHASKVCDSLLHELGDFENATAQVRAGLDRIVSLTHDLGLLGRKPEFRREPFVLQSAVESAIQLTEHRIRGRATLVREYADTPVVLGDEPRLTQVFVNLLVNASQAVDDAPAGANRIRVGISRVSAGALAVVEDTGVGITPEMAAHLFEPYFSTKPAGEGTGLGLAISREIVTAHGGSIQFTSQPGKGSRFTVIIPTAPPDSAFPAA